MNNPYQYQPHVRKKTMTVGQINLSNVTAEPNGSIMLLNFFYFFHSWWRMKKENWIFLCDVKWIKCTKLLILNLVSWWFGWNHHISKAHWSRSNNKVRIWMCSLWSYSHLMVRILDIIESVKKSLTRCVFIVEALCEWVVSSCQFIGWWWLVCPILYTKD